MKKFTMLSHDYGWLEPIVIVSCATQKNPARQLKRLRCIEWAVRKGIIINEENNSY